uniref:Uncharacterized protein n=1 Tax=Palpitomonas bilix TaxID=652834 RepID=A0A7S3GAT6_9EUKA|mmetsp:Transcript_42176/g.108619  ORF Transcript_42176/g.108619 Transcript_42176/m.108619 type:complete len:292 (+) Transcript_42176:408-1283(+)
MRDEKAAAERRRKNNDDDLTFCLSLPNKIVWVESVLVQARGKNDWGIIYNAAQFEETLSYSVEGTSQNRNRVVGGRFPSPSSYVYREYQRSYHGVCPCITASEYKGCATDNRRASRFYGRRLTIEECAKRMGFTVPQDWYTTPKKLGGKATDYTASSWRMELYKVIGSGVCVYVAEAFGKAAMDGAEYFKMEGAGSKFVPASGEEGGNEEKEEKETSVKNEEGRGKDKQGEKGKRIEKSKCTLRTIGIAFERIKKKEGGKRRGTIKGEKRERKKNTDGGGGERSGRGVERA